MVYTKITSPDSSTITLQPISIGSYSFQEFECKAFQDGSISRDICFRDRTSENINVTASSLVDGTTALTEAAYWLYACFKNKKLDKIGLCKDGNTPVNYEYYTKINFVINVNSSLEFLTFSDAEIRENYLVSGGWIDVSLLNIASGYSKNTNQPPYIRRNNDIIELIGSITKDSGNFPASGNVVLFDIPKGFLLVNTRSLYCSAAGNALIFSIYNMSLGSMALNFDLSISPSTTNLVLFGAQYYIGI